MGNTSAPLGKIAPWTLANITGNVNERLGVCLRVAVAGMVFARVGNTRYKELSEEARQLIVKKRNKLVNRLKLSAMETSQSPPLRQD